jgi:hypothetical protein
VGRDLTIVLQIPADLVAVNDTKWKLEFIISSRKEIVIVFAYKNGKKKKCQPLKKFQSKINS